MKDLLKKVFTAEEFENVRRLAYENGAQEITDIGFVFRETWITNPFTEETGRFEFTDFDAMCKYYGKDNVYAFLETLLASHK